jgi:hypothetical protein
MHATQTQIIIYTKRYDRACAAKRLVSLTIKAHLRCCSQSKHTCARHTQASNLSIDPIQSSRHIQGWRKKHGTLPHRASLLRTFGDK